MPPMLKRGKIGVLYIQHSEATLPVSQPGALPRPTEHITNQEDVYFLRSRSTYIKVIAGPLYPLLPIPRDRYMFAA